MSHVSSGFCHIFRMSVLCPLLPAGLPHTSSALGLCPTELRSFAIPVPQQPWALRLERCISSAVFEGFPSCSPLTTLGSCIRASACPWPGGAGGRAGTTACLWLLTGTESEPWVRRERRTAEPGAPSCLRAHQVAASEAGEASETRTRLLGAVAAQAVRADGGRAGRGSADARVRLLGNGPG